MPAMDISSTAIRQALWAGEQPRGLPQGVEAYLMLKGLYGEKRWLPQGSQWLDKLYGMLSPQRFAHTLYVVAYARHLAEVHGVNLNQAVCAALLHDCAKCMKLEEMQEAARKHDLVADQAIFNNGNLLHSAVGAQVAREAFGISDPEVLEAIACHTLGRIPMTPLDMIVFLADKIEASRAAYPLLEAIRQRAEESLPGAVRLSLESTAAYVAARGGVLHPATLEVITWLKEGQAQ